MNFTSDQWVIVALIFVLGFLIGGFLFSGGGRKWKARYREEVSRREALEQAQIERAAAIRNPPPAARDLEEERRIEERRVAERRSDDSAT